MKISREALLTIGLVIVSFIILMGYSFPQGNTPFTAAVDTINTPTTVSLAPVVLRFNESGAAKLFANSGTNPNIFGYCMSARCPSISFGKSGNGVDFKGTSNVALATSSIFRNPQFSFGGWVKMSSSQSVDRIAGMHGKQKANSGYLLNLINGVPQFAIGTGSVWNVLTANTKYTLTNNAWYHIVGTYNGSSAKLYVNGSLVGQNTNVRMDLPENAALFMIGDDYKDSPANALNGSVDTFFFYQKVLTDAEVTALYKQN